uniref:F-box domain-containing protein n=1 Tax=Plectus sambesii TaxID=2011161 RepID=A0A914XMM4_9BILA
MAMDVGEERPLSDATAGLSSEVLAMVFAHLPTKSRVLAALTCRRWLHLLAPSFSTVSDLRIVLEESSCTPSFQVDQIGEKLQLCVSVCQCAEHLASQVSLLRALMIVVGPSLEGIVVDDCLVGPNAFVADASVHTILLHCPPTLVRFELHNVDVSQLHPWTLAQLASMDNLRELVVEQCAQRMADTHPPPLLTDIFLGKLMSASSHQLSQVRITDCPLVSDRLLNRLARHCPNLWLVDVSGCKQVTAIGVVSFCETIEERQADTLVFQANGAGVVGDHLARHLQSPYSRMSQESRWFVVSIDVEIGYPKKAARLHKQACPSKAIIVFA